MSAINYSFVMAILLYVLKINYTFMLCSFRIYQIKHIGQFK